MSSTQSDHTDTSLTQVLLAENFVRRGGHLIFDGCAIGELAETYGTPLYAYSERILQQSWDRLRDAFSADFQVFYSMKANPHRAFLSFFVERGSGIEVASGGELQRALSAGCPADRIIYAGPGKTDGELKLAVDRGIGEIHVESRREFERLARIAADAARSTTVALRVNPDLPATAGSLQMGGRPSPFGIDEGQLDNFLSMADDQWIDVRGIHLNTGTQILDADVLLAYYRHAIELGRRVSARLADGLRTLDLGGGLGIPYFEGQRSLDMASLKPELEALVCQCRHDPLLKNAQLMIEPGRYLSGECGIYVMRVLDVKISRGHTFVIADGGMHHHAAATGNFGQTLKRPFPMVVANRQIDATPGDVSIVGPLCTPLDTFARKLPLAGIKEGDLLVVMQSGAYARSASPLEFLGHPHPPELWLNDGMARQIRPRGSYQDDETYGEQRAVKSFDIA